MMKWWVVVSLLAGCGSKASDTDNKKAAYAKAALVVNPVVKQLKGASARIMTVPEKADLSTFPTLAQDCVKAKDSAKALSALASDKDPGVSLLGNVVDLFVEVTDGACKDITYAEAAECWKACSTEWGRFEIALIGFTKSAEDYGVTVDPLE